MLSMRFVETHVFTAKVQAIDGDDALRTCR